MFDWETQLLCMHCREIGPDLAATGSLMGFFELRQEPGVYSRVTAGMPFETLVCSLKSGTCLGMRDK